jgi:hypothetical protein
MGAFRRGRRLIAIVLLIALAPLFSGCYGTFPMTKIIYKLNNDVSDNKVVKTVVFWVFVIFPVYDIGMLADAFVFNLIEFWTDKPVMASMTTDGNGHTFALAPAANGRDATLTISRDGKVLAVRQFVKVSDAVIEVRDTDGHLYGKVIRTADGGLQLADEHANVIDTLSAQSLASLATTR